MKIFFQPVNVYSNTFSSVGGGTNTIFSSTTSSSSGSFMGSVTVMLLSYLNTIFILNSYAFGLTVPVFKSLS